MLSTLQIDLNCDMGEGMETDAEIMPFISSANIACGYHAGDADTMRRTIENALRLHVVIGAHPSYPDRSGFGRKDILEKGVSPDQVPAMIIDQLMVLQTACGEFGTRLHHVKPHGALYNRAAADPAVSALVCRAIYEFDPTLLLYGLSGSCMKPEADRRGLRFVSEVFADRTYAANGSLTPRTQPHALIADSIASIAQVLQIVENGTVTPQSSGAARLPDIPLIAETICLHGDGDHAVTFARTIHAALTSRGIGIRAPAL